VGKQFRKGTDLIKQSAENKGGKRKFTRNIYWKPGDVKTIAFLTAAEEIPKVRLHQMVRIPDDRFESGIRYETFLCKKDPSMSDESGGECELCDRVEHDAVERFVALAVELEPIKEGKRVTGLEVMHDTVTKDDGEEVKYPRWGIIIQASKNFFSYFAAYAESQGDIREVAWTIEREGGSTDTKYHQYIVTNGPRVVELPDLSEMMENIPALEDLLEEMGSEEKYAQVAELDPGSQPSFGGNKKPELAGVPSGDRADKFAEIRQVIEGY